VTNDELVGNHDIAPTLARMGASFPAFVDGRSFLPLAQNPSASWSRTAILSEKETGSDPNQMWEMLRMPDKTYALRGTGEKEYYDLNSDPYQVRNAFSTSETDPPQYPRPIPTPKPTTRSG
jgi:N-acetylglucosamine-6-sulfatase